MTRRLKRSESFEITLLLKDDAFIAPPRVSQRNWLLNSALTEFSENLKATSTHAARFAAGRDPEPMADRTQAPLPDDEIMEDWQVPLMRAMADIACAQGGDVLEVGYGRGVSARFIQERGARSHTIIECNESILRRCEAWRARHADRDIRVVSGLWQDVLPDLGQFDAVFFHTYPLNESEMLEQIGDSTTFAEHFFAHAAAHLRPGGRFTYLSNEIDSLGRPHQRALFAHFSEIRTRVLHGLPVPEDVRDAWWSDSMVVVEAIR